MRSKFVILKNVATVRSGVTNVENDIDVTKYKLIQLKDINDEGILSYDLETVYASNINYSQTLQYNDIIFKAKSSQNVAGILKRDGKYIATAQYFIITVNNNCNILPDYIWWYLNQSETRKHFEKMASGSSTIIVKKPDIESLKIQIPSKEKQERIVYIYRLWLEEKELYRKKIEEKDRYIKQGLYNTLFDFYK